MKSYFLLGVVLLFNTKSIYCQNNMKIVYKNRMSVQWKFEADRLYFELEAPTAGWVAIGFNTNEEMKGNYLIMANIINNEVNVEEHYTSSPGNYKSFKLLHINSSVLNVSGTSKHDSSFIRFSLPILANSKFARDFVKGQPYWLMLAYSEADDFQHHSMMRTFEKIIL